MKNTAYAITSNGTVAPLHQSFVSRWGGLPLLILVMVAGMPLRHKLEPSRQFSMEEVSSATQDALSASQSFNSLPFTIFMGSLYFFAFWVLLHRPKASVSILRRQWPIVALLGLVGLSFLWSYNRDKVLLTLIHNTGEIMIALAAALRYRTSPWLLPRHLGYAMGLNVALQVGAVIVIPSIAIDWYGRWTGLTTQPNTLGIIALFAFWANMAAVVCRKTPDKYHMHLIMAALAVAAMIGANSVTSMLCAASSLVVLYVLSRADRTGRIRPRLYLLTLAVTLFTVAASLLLMTDSIDLNKLFGLAGRSGDFTGRTEIWMEGIKSISQRPLLGWSFDDNAYVIKVSHLAYTSYHNGYLDLAVRGGAVAVTLFILLMTTWARDLGKRTRLGRELMPISVSFVVAMLVHNMTEAWLVGPRNHVWTIFMVLLFLGACRRWSVVPAMAADLNRPFYGLRSLA